MLVRERQAADEPQLIEIAQLVHTVDRYPLYLPDSEYETFLFGHETLGAWVAEDELGVIGQVALHPRSSAPVMDLAVTELARPAHRLGVVARLLVHPNRRRLGAGGQLLQRAAREAAALGLLPILDVVKDLTEAVLLYEQQGWLRIGEVSVTFGQGVTINEFVYLAPPILRPA